MTKMTIWCKLRAWIYSRPTDRAGAGSAGAPRERGGTEMWCKHSAMPAGAFVPHMRACDAGAQIIVEQSYSAEVAK